MRNMRIGARLSIGFLVVIALLVAMAISSHVILNNLSHYDDLIGNNTNLERSSREWARAASNQGLLLYAFAYAVQPEMIQRFARQITGYGNDIDNRIKEINALQLDPEEVQMLRELDAKRTVYREAMAELFKANHVTASGELTGTQPPFAELRDLFMNKVIPARDAYITLVDQFRDYEIASNAKLGDELVEVYSFAKTMLNAITAAAVIIALLIAWRLTIGITRPLNEAVSVAQTVAGGDLTSRIEVTSRDETGQLMQAMKDMNEYLYTAITQVRQSADTIATASSQIASGNQDLSARTEQQASSLEETASSMEEITSTVRQNGDNARQANQLASQAADVATKGGEAAGQVAETMRDIEDSSKKIVDIISVIDGIAFQTNILALNAAVEAARAGEQGRGFAVVATEVRSLAQRSATAAREIKDLIDDSVTKVTAGTELVNNAVNTILEIGESIRRVNDIMNEITMATQEQVQGIEQVNQAVTEMDTVSQQNAALVEEAAAAAESLQDQARALVGVVSLFNTGTGSSAPRPALSAPISSGATPVARPAAPAKRLAAPAKAAVPAAAAAPAAIGGGGDDDGGDWEEF